LVRQALSMPLACIIANSGRDAGKEMAKLAKTGNGRGFDARTGAHVDMFKAGIVDPVKVCYSAVCNAGSVAALILTTQTLIAKKPDDFDVTAGPARGGGAEKL
jgi:chaperonin GroEL